MDAAGSQRICTGFGRTSDDLSDAFILCARHIAATHVDPIFLEAYTASRLIRLAKQPGVRQIRIKEVVRRIVGKVILKVVGPTVEQTVGCLQLRGGQECGIEAAIHAIRSTFQLDKTEAVLFADASNAFNCLNRQVAKHNIQHLCPEFSNTVVNTYYSPSRLFVSGQFIWSCESMTQGDPLATWIQTTQ